MLRSSPLFPRALPPFTPVPRLYIHRAAPPPVTGVRPKLITSLSVGGVFIDTVRGVGLEFTSLNPSTDTAVVTVLAPPIITSGPASVASTAVGSVVTLSVAATGYRNTYVGRVWARGGVGWTSVGGWGLVETACPEQSVERWGARCGVNMCMCGAGGE
jgi:hypothetical protein